MALSPSGESMVHPFRGSDTESVSESSGKPLFPVLRSGLGKHSAAKTLPHRLFQEPPAKSSPPSS